MAGIRSKICRPHVFGLDQRKPKTFLATCPKCQELLAAGLRTGHEPHPSEVYLPAHQTMRKRIRGEAFDAMLAAKRKQRKASAELPIHRRDEE
jgi:hypothetical protein